MKNGNKVSKANNVTHSPKANPKKLNTASGSTDSECEILFCFSGGLRTPTRTNYHLIAHISIILKIDFYKSPIDNTETLHNRKTIFASVCLYDNTQTVFRIFRKPE